MSATAGNFDLDIYVDHFPPAGDKLDEGTVKAVDGLAGGAVRCGARVTVVCEGPQTTRTRGPGGYEIACFARADLKQYIEGLDADALWVLNGMFHPRVFAIARMLDRQGVGYVVAPHDPYHPSIFARRSHLKWPYWYLRERPLLRRARAVQVLDDRHGRFLLELGVKTPVIATCNGYAPQDVCPEESLSWRHNGSPSVLFLGRLDEFNKGLDLLIEAFGPMSNGNGSGARLTIRGPDWGDGPKLRKLARKHAGSEEASILPADYSRRPWQIIAEHDVFCLPSRFEGFGLSALEAMLAARVVLVSEVAGIAPHVKASGCGIVTKASAQAIRESFSQLLARRSEWKAMGLAGRRYALEHLQWEHIAHRLLQEYRKLISP